MNAKQKLHQAKLNEWANRFAEQKAQGLSNKEWCRINNVSIHSYNYWKHILKEELVDQVLPDIVPVSLSPIVSHSLPAAPSHSLLSSSTSCTIRANCATYKLSVNGFDFELDSNVSVEFLSTLLKAVRYA